MNLSFQPCFARLLASTARWEQRFIGAAASRRVAVATAVGVPAASDGVLPLLSSAGWLSVSSTGGLQAVTTACSGKSLSKPLLGCHLLKRVAALALTQSCCTPCSFSYTVYAKELPVWTAIAAVSNQLLSQIQSRMLQHLLLTTATRELMLYAGSSSTIRH
jgi:hypothetical protein